MKILLRIVTALSTAALVVAGLLLVPLAVVIPAMILLVALVHLEFSQMVAKRYPILVRLGVVAGVAYLLNRVYAVPAANGFSALVVLFFLLALRTLFGKSERPIAELATTVLGFVYIPVMLSYFILVPVRFGMMTLLFLIAAVKFADMGGFALGLTLGRHKLCPSVSPNKTWEGLFGSFLAGSLMALLFWYLTSRGIVTSMKAYPLGVFLSFGAAAAAVGTLGDLVESRMKRECGVKDSATFMPAGLGGFLDMFDSLVFAPAVLYPFL